MASQNFEPIHFPDFRDKIDTKKNPLLGSLFLFFVFFITFLFVYFLYVCARRRHDAASRDSNTPPEVVAGLDPATISSLPVSSYGSIGKTPSHGAECAICLSLFQECDKVKVLPLCRHGFHSDCVDEWLRTRSSCPLCRGCVHRVDSLGGEFETRMWMVP